MKKIILLLATISSCHCYTVGQTLDRFHKDGMYKFDDSLKVLTSDLFTIYKSEFGFGNNDEVIPIAENDIDTIGTHHARYKQYYKGYPIEASMMNVISKYGVALQMNGFWLPGFTKEFSTPVLEADALVTALGQVPAPIYPWQDSAYENAIKWSIDPNTADSVYDATKTYYPKGELVIARPFNDTSIHDTSTYALCWKFCITPMYLDTITVDTSSVDSIVSLKTVIGYRIHENSIVYINAETGEVYTVDPNRYSAGFYVTCGIHSTWYEGNQNAQALKFTVGVNYHLQDSRRIIATDDATSCSSCAIKNNNINFPRSTGASAFWQLERAYDYFGAVHGFYGPGGGSRILHIAVNNTTSGSSDRVHYQYNPSYDWDEFFLKPDVSSGGSISQSAAQLDVMCHEYTHAINEHGPRLGGGYNYESSAILEGFCDWFGVHASSQAYMSRYASDWTNGFGWQTGQFARHFTDPTTDVPNPSSGRYLDTHWQSYYSGDQKYINSGVLRHWFYMMANGGTYYGIYIDPISLLSMQRDSYITMYWWLWSSAGYYDLARQTLAEYEYYYGKCSKEWRSAARAWTALGVGSYPYPDCPNWIMVGPDVLNLNDGLGSPTAGRIRVNPTDGATAAYYTWKLPATWNVTFYQSNSEMSLDSTTDYDSHMVTCIVTNTDSTKDTVTTFLHIINNEAKHSNAHSNNVVSTAEEMTIYPNPAKNYLNIMLTETPKSPMSFKISDFTGREFYSNIINSKTTQFYLPNLPPGLYITRITGNGKDYVKKLTIE